MAVCSRCSDRCGSVMVIMQSLHCETGTAEKNLKTSRSNRPRANPTHSTVSACQNHKQATQVPEPETLLVGLLCRRYADLVQNSVVARTGMEKFERPR